MNKVPELIAALRSEVGSAPVADLPAIIGQVEVLKVEAFVRLVTPESPLDAHSSAGSGGDRLLNVDETAQLLGQTPRWVRHHQRELPQVNLPGRTVRFSERRLAVFIRRRGCT
jgi:hypothetical protein